MLCMTHGGVVLMISWFRTTGPPLLLLSPLESKGYCQTTTVDHTAKRIYTWSFPIHRANIFCAGPAKILLFILP